MLPSGFSHAAHRILSLRKILIIRLGFGVYDTIIIIRNLEEPHSKYEGPLH